MGMGDRSIRSRGGFWTIVAVIAGAAGCAGEAAPPTVAHERVGVIPPEPELPMGPLPVAWNAQPAPDTLMARADGTSVDARLLVLSASGSSASLAAITTVLGYLGTPYDVVNASMGPEVTDDYLAAGDHGRYQGILLDSGDLAVGSASAFTDAEWMALASYEARFGVRRAVVYAHPSAAYGLVLTAGTDARSAPIAAHCTAEGTTVFVGANCAGPVMIDDGYAYGSKPSDAATVPLLLDDAGNVFAATRTYPDGREVLLLTFAQSPTAFHTLALGYGVVNWVTRGVFIGERHTYASPQIDDFYLASKISTGGTYRITADDLQAFANWQNAHRADPLMTRFRSAFAFNALRAQPGQDPLTDKGRELQSNFTWINHTWDHADMNAMSYATAFEELSKNNQYGIGAGFDDYTVENLVTPGISGLDNSEVMRAAFDVGIRQLVSDTSQPGQGNPTPNAGYYNAQNAGLLMVPRRPVDLYFDVSQPAEWIAEYSARHNNGAFTYDQLVAAVSDSLARYLLRGENDPWMFHQANLRDIGGGKSLLSDVLDAAFAKYAARATFPILSPTMDELSERVEERMDLDASGASATIGPGQQISVRVTNAATVPITGVCTPTAETYAGQQITYLPLAAGQAMTLSLADCNPGIGGGTGGSSGWGSNSRSDGGTTVGTLGNGDGAVGTGVAPDAGCTCGVSDANGQRGAWALLIVIAAAAIARRRYVR